MSLPSACRCHDGFQPYFGYSQKGMTEKNYLEKWYPFHVSGQYRKIHQKWPFFRKIANLEDKDLNGKTFKSSLKLII